jgi:hypothetical protein
MRSSHRVWTDAPMLYNIQSGDIRYQPETSHAAMQKFERMIRDTDSVVSRAATWGTRRHSLPSILDSDIDGVTSGSFLKKLSISRGETRLPGILGGVRTLLKKPNSSYKRSRTAMIPEDDSSESTGDRRDSRETLAPPTRSLSGGFTKKQPIPSINTALVSVSNSVAAIGTTHVRSGSISTPLGTPLPLPRAPTI